MNNTDNRRVPTPLVVAAGVTLGVVTYAAGVKTGFRLKNLAAELAAYSIVLGRLQEANPALVKEASDGALAQLEGISAALLQK